MWTEILNERIGVTHVCGQHVIWAIGTDVRERDVRAAKDELMRREAHERFIEQSRQMRQNMAERERAVERLENAGYDRSEIPL